ncbi:hypothetical protein O6H91_09G083300 [Diphasiastrum complanatum]|uniref:Uncharacterized protein n=1 Tax=Diphasiastrum complanatum TaxID=34168 RepID=A0ACC2CRA9_DIPCM|nr:hypothetical protein O6H91_09G083300 [Diphasiastrum complanatum]
MVLNQNDFRHENIVMKQLVVTKHSDNFLKLLSILHGKFLVQSSKKWHVRESFFSCSATTLFYLVQSYICTSYCLAISPRDTSLEFESKLFLTILQPYLCTSWIAVPLQKDLR